MTNPFKVWDGTQWLLVNGVQGEQGEQGLPGADSTVPGPAGVLDSDPDYSVNDWWNTTQSAGRIFGGKITPNPDGTVNIAAGTGVIKAEAGGPEDCPCDGDTAPISQNSYITWDAVTNLALTDDAYNFIYYQGSTNSIVATTNFYSIDFLRDFTIGRAFRTGNDVVVRLCGTNLWNFNRRVQLFGEEVFPVVRATGMIVGETGTRNITVSSSILWAELVNRFTTTPFDSSGTDRFTYWYRNSPTGFISVPNQSQIDNLNFDNNTGTLAELSPSRHGVHWVYVVHDSTIHVVYGRGSYTLNQAEAATPPISLPGLLSAYATLAAKVIIFKNSSTMTVASAFDTVFATSGTAETHNELAGLDGGIAGEYYHLTSAEATSVSNLATVATSGSYADLSNIPATFTPDSHTHTPMDVSISGQSGGTNYRIVRMTTTNNTWTDASNTDTLEELTGLVYKRDGTYYPPGSVITGLSGLTAGTHYFLGTGGTITPTQPSTSSTVRRVVIGKAISGGSGTSTLLFYPGTPIGGE